MKKRWLWAATLLLVAAATTFSATRINLATQVRGILGRSNMPAEVAYEDEANAFAVGGQTITSEAVGVVPLVLKGFTAQTALYFDVQTSTSASIFQVSPTGLNHVTILRANYVGTPEGRLNIGKTGGEPAISVRPFAGSTGSLISLYEVGSSTNKVFGIETDADTTIRNFADQTLTLTLDSGSTTTQITRLDFNDQGVLKIRIRKDVSNAFAIDVGATSSRINLASTGSSTYRAGSTSADHLFQNSAATLRITLHGDSDKISFGSAADVNLYRGAAGRLQSDDGIRSTNGAEYAELTTIGRINARVLTSTSTFLGVRKSTVDTVDRFTMDGSGRMEWGSGAAAADIALYRSGVDTLQMDDLLRSQRASVGNPSFSTLVVGDGFSRFLILADGAMSWGTGAASRDTNLFRSAADTLKTDDNFIVGNVFETTDDGTERILLINRDFGDPKTGIIRIRGDLSTRFLELKWDGAANAAFITNSGLGDLNIQNLFSGGDIAFSTVGTGDFTFSNGDIILGAGSGFLRGSTTGPELPTSRSNWITNQWNAQIYQSTDGGTYPFDVFGNLIIQSRTSSGGGQRDIVFATGQTTPVVRMVVHRDGDVGIGTATPNEPLEVAAASGLTQLSLKRTNTNTVGTLGSVVFTNSADAILAEIRVLGSGTNTDADMVFFTKTSAGALTEQMRILDSGDVGIGTETPDEMLHVSGGRVKITTPSGDQRSIFIDGGSPNRITFGVSGSAVIGITTVSNFISMATAGQMTLAPKAESDLIITLSGAGDLVVNTDQLFVDTSSGNVGIGTTSPDEKLEVAGSIGSTTGILVDTGASSGFWTIRGTNAGRRLDIATESSNIVFDAYGTGATPRILMQVEGANILAMQSDGNVGIGTTTPVHDLQIGDGTNEALSIAFKGNIANIQSFVWEASDASDRFTQYANLDASSANDLLIFRSLNNDNILVLEGGGDVGIGIANPSANLHVVGDFKIGTSGAGITEHLSSTGSVNIPAVGQNSCDISQSVTVTGAVSGDSVAIGLPSGLGGFANLAFTPYATTDAVVVKACCVRTGAACGDPIAFTVRADVWKH